MKRIVLLSRYILAALFVFSGFVKSVDPMGTAIKIREYLVAFHLDILTDIAPWLAVLLCGMELLLGLMLLFGLFKKITAYITLLFMCFFTLLTFYILIASPVSDCGCFGDAVTLSNHATFIKNLIFTAVAIFYVFHIRHENIVPQKSYLPLFLSIAISFGIPIHALFFLPVIDFLPYKTGVNIPEAMSIPEGAPQSEYKTTLVYKNIKTGDIQEFELEDTTWYDSTTWEYIDTKNEVVVQGYVPPISHFAILDENGKDRSTEILSDAGDQFWIILPEKEKLNPSSLQNLSALNQFAENTHTPIITFTTQTPNEITTFLSEHGIKTISYNVDPIVLKSMIRSRLHSGIIFLHKGTILAKWSMNTLPVIKTEKELQTLINRNHYRLFFFCSIWILYIVAMTSYCIRHKQ